MSYVFWIVHEYPVAGRFCLLCSRYSLFCLSFNYECLDRIPLPKDSKLDRVVQKQLEHRKHEQSAETNLKGHQEYGSVN